MWAPVCAVLGPQGAGLPGARFVTGGDKGTDFSIMNRPGAALGKPFFTCRSSKKQQGEVVFSFPSNGGGGGGGAHHTPQPSLPSEANAARAHSPPRGQPPHGIPAPRPRHVSLGACASLSHTLSGSGELARGAGKVEAESEGPSRPLGSLPCGPRFPGVQPGKGAGREALRVSPAGVTQLPPGALAAGVARVLVGSQGLQTTVTLPSLIDKRRAALPR